ncbi:MAG: hypothetical protein MUP76_04615 [Acidimicrobiia bacterium]|nr:hypothetical protein [Acidimicrobiia bacterium]
MTMTETDTLSAKEMCKILDIGETQLHRLSKLYGYEHKGSGNYTRYLWADIPAFRAILAVQEFVRGGDSTRGTQGLAPEMLARIGHEFAETRTATLEATIDGITITLTVDDL